MLCHFLYKVLISKYISRSVEADFVIYDTDMLLHPVVYSTLHFPWIERFNQVARFKVLYRLFGIKRNGIIFFLDTDPSVALERILKRSRSRDPHENPRDLEHLKRKFDALLAVASKSGLDIVRINTNDRSLGSIVSEVEIVLRQKFALIS